MPMRARLNLAAAMLAIGVSALAAPAGHAELRSGADTSASSSVSLEWTRIPHSAAAEVSCPAVRSCQLLSGESAAGWNGSTLRSESLPTPGDASHGRPDFLMQAIDCPSVRSCFAVGGYRLRSTAHLRALVEHWNGRRWQIVPTPNPDPSLRKPVAVHQSALSSISCASVTSCVAVGKFGTNGRFGGWFSETYDGRTWRTQRVGPPKSNTGPIGISCASAMFCAGVDKSMIYNGRSWSALTSGPGARLADRAFWVSCPAVGVCEATWESGTSIGFLGLAAGQWTQQATPALPAYPDESDPYGLGGVDCPAIDACVAVGSGHVSEAIFYTWDGSAWTVDRPAPAINISPVAVSCATASYCVATSPEGSVVGQPASTSGARNG